MKDSPVRKNFLQKKRKKIKKNSSVKKSMRLITAYTEEYAGGVRVLSNLKYIYLDLWFEYIT